MDPLLVNTLPGIKGAKAGKETGPEESLFVEENLSPLLCLSFGKAGRIEVSFFSPNRGISSLVTVM